MGSVMNAKQGKKKVDERMSDSKAVPCSTLKMQRTNTKVREERATFDSTLSYQAAHQLLYEGPEHDTERERERDVGILCVNIYMMILHWKHGTQSEPKMVREAKKKRRIEAEVERAQRKKTVNS